MAPNDTKMNHGNDRMVFCVCNSVAEEFFTKSVGNVEKGACL